MKLPEQARKKRQPTWISPELATLVKEPFSKKGWLFEKKFDGVRVIVVKKGDRVSLYSRNKKKMNVTYPELLPYFRKQKAEEFIVDGEIVAGEGKLGDFSKLQGRMGIQKEEKARSRGISISVYLFDILFLEGYDFRRVPLLQRKKVLKKALSFEGKLHYTSHLVTKGKAFFERVCKKGWEGAIAKDCHSIYTSKRTKKWLKFKGSNRQEFIICGFTDPAGSRMGFGSLLIGYKKGKKIIYAGKVGTGFNDETLNKLGKKLRSLEKKKSPFDDPISVKKAHYVKPTLVCEIAFTEWTSDGKLRHPSFLGLRSDKPASKVKKEYAKKR